MIYRDNVILRSSAPHRATGRGQPPGNHQSRFAVIIVAHILFHNATFHDQHHYNSVLRRDYLTEREPFKTSPLVTIHTWSRQECQ
jgi:hypothetical protein